MSRPKKTSFKVPQSFNEYLHEHAISREKATTKAARQRKEAAVAERRQQANDKKKAKRDLPYAERIFEWATCFRESDAGKRALAALPARHRCEKTLGFFEWHGDDGKGWGYDLSITDSGIRWYRFGPGSEIVVCTTPAELAWHVQTGMLKAACQAIESGEVWHWIKEDLDLFKNDEQ